MRKPPTRDGRNTARLHVCGRIEHFLRDGPRHRKEILADLLARNLIWSEKPDAYLTTVFSLHGDRFLYVGEGYWSINPTGECIPAYAQFRTLADEVRIEAGLRPLRPPR